MMENACNYNMDGKCAVRGIDCSENCYNIKQIDYEACIENMALIIDAIKEYLGQRGKSDTKDGILEIFRREKAPGEEQKISDGSLTSKEIEEYLANEPQETMIDPNDDLPNERDEIPEYRLGDDEANE